MRFNKYRNKPTEVDGIFFHSKGEAGRYRTLIRMQQAGEIRDLELQTPFKIEVGGIKICTYRADFTYRTKNNEYIVEDFKGMKTAIYKLKKKLVKAIYGIDILEIG